MHPVLDLARRLDIATNPSPKAIFEAGMAGFQIWGAPTDHPKDWDGVVMTAGTFSKPCEYVAAVSWGWEGETITHLDLSTYVYALGRNEPNHNRPADLAWAKRKVRWLFKKAGVTCLPLVIER